MINVQIAESIISIITFLIAYVISVTFSGAFTAWLALKLGDETPADNGFLTFNPLAHIDILGTLFLMMHNFGWGKFIIINPANITGRFQTIKIIFAFLGKTIANFLLALVSLLILVALFGKEIIPLYGQSSSSASSSYLYAIGIILAALLFVNMTLAVINFFVNMCGLLVMVITDRQPEYSFYYNMIMIFVPILLYYLVGPQLVMLAFGLITKVGYFIASWAHLI